MDSLVISIAAQKGGVGKSTLSRLLATVFADLGWNVKIADLDIGQATSFKWRSRRLASNIQPDVPVEQFRDVKRALDIAKNYDLLILDHAPHATAAMKDAAIRSDLNIIATGLAKDDLEPGVLVAHELFQKGVPRDKIVFALCRVGESAIEIHEAREYLQKAGYDVLPGSLPEQTAYRRASDQGKSLIETSFPSLKLRAEEVAQGMVDRISQLAANAEPAVKKRSVG